MMMDAKETVRIYEKAKKYPYFQGYRQPEIGEDFAAYAIIRLIKGRKATFKQLFIDFLRLQFGDTRIPEGILKSKARWNTKDHNDYAIPCLKSYNKDEISIELYLDSFNPINNIDRACIILFFKWGFTMPEIGELFNVTAPRIHERIRKIRLMKHDK